MGYNCRGETYIQTPKGKYESFWFLPTDLKSTLHIRGLFLKNVRVINFLIYE